MSSWLRDLGLERYGTAFRENDVRAEVLCHLTAHEEDAERAVRAALEIVHTVKRASSIEDLSVRIGIATGLVGNRCTWSQE